MTALQQILPNVWLLKPGYSAETHNTLNYERLFVAALPSVSNEWNLCVEESVKFYGKTDEQTKRGGGLCFNSWLMIIVMRMMIPKTRRSKVGDIVSRELKLTHTALKPAFVW